MQYKYWLHGVQCYRTSLYTYYTCAVGVVIHTTDAEAEAASSNGSGDENELETLISTVPPVKELKDLKIVPLEFEKV